MNECEHLSIDWDDEPDFHGCHGISIKWFGECADCGIRVYERFSSRGSIEECEKER